MKYEEIQELLIYGEHESKVFMPNEIFKDLNGAIKNSPHLGFSYSYIYLVHWLYRYAKYLTVNGFIDNGKMKEILGYTAITKGLDYLIKKNGVLEKLGYLMTVKDFPTFVKYSHEVGGELEFYMLSDMDEIEREYVLKGSNLSRKYSIKFPVRAFYRYMEDEEMKNDYDNGYQDGTYFDVSNTHCIPFEVFMYCMDNEEVNCIGFYLYSYLKYQNDKFSNGYDVSVKNLSKETGLSTRTINRYLDALKKFNLIRFTINQEFVVGLEQELRRANTYFTNEHFAFKDIPQEYIKRKVISTKTYFNQTKESERIDQEIEELFV